LGREYYINAKGELFGIGGTAPITAKGRPFGIGVKDTIISSKFIKIMDNVKQSQVVHVLLRYVKMTALSGLGVLILLY
jgi:hypothetical protein